MVLFYVCWDVDEVYIWIKGVIDFVWFEGFCIDGVVDEFLEGFEVGELCMFG